TASSTGGGGIGNVDNGTLSVTATAGQKYVFSIAYAGQASTSYSITFDATFSQLVKTSASNA
ncbi:MAG: hypothetical protein JWO31_3058, partial [Phycisphaerales bacterium]|nr:hypothetical protein [Phycisphaerales bacterium]